MVSVFSISAFFIVLREVLEACLVVGVSLAYFERTGSKQYIRWVWFGTATGVLVSFAFGIAFAIVFYVRGDQIFERNVERIFEGITFLTGAALLTWMIVWMLLVGKELRLRMEGQLGAIVENDQKAPWRRKVGVFLLVFVQILREGIETVIFLFGSANASEFGGWKSIPIPAIIATVLGITSAYLVFKGLVTLDIQAFFKWSSVVLIAFAAALVSHGFHELQEVGWFGSYSERDDPQHHWYNEAMWSTRTCCPDDSNEFFAMLRALLGYQDTPSFIEWITYFSYWLIVLTVYVIVDWKRIRASKVATYQSAGFLSVLALFMTFVGFVYVLTRRTWIGIVSMSLAFVLSIISVVFMFCPLILLLPFLLKFRRSGARLIALCWVALTLLMTVMHLLQLVCEGAYEERCHLGKFFFFGLLLNDAFNSLGRTQTTNSLGEVKIFWPAIAVLSVSLVISVFFFGFLALHTFLFSLNIADDGVYMHDDYVDVKDGACHTIPADFADNTTVSDNVV